MTAKQVRRAMFAGSWYPADASDCEREIQHFLHEGKSIPAPAGTLVGGIVPHAGWFFSGSIACNVIHFLQDGDPPDMLAIFGMHLHPDSSCFIMKQGAYQTPFGELAVADNLAAELTGRFSFSVETPSRFNPDNTVELQLPFIKYFFPNARIVTMGVPPAKSSLAIGTAVVEIAGQLGLKIKVIGSTDLTHYGYNYGFVSKGMGKKAVDWVRNENDRRVIEAMLAMDPERIIQEGLKNQNACCAGAAATAISAGKKLGATKAEKLVYASSYDKNPGDSFVGYVGIVF
jgi:AmmeMemoRadiSam system protein B